MKLQRRTYVSAFFIFDGSGETREFFNALYKKSMDKTTESVLNRLDPQPTRSTTDSIHNRLGCFI